MNTMHTEIGLPALDGLAYSSEPDAPAPPPLRQPWSDVLYRGAAAVLAGIFVALVIGAAGILWWHPATPTSPWAQPGVPPVLPAPEPGRVDMPSPTLPAVPDGVRKIGPDELFNVLLAQANVVPDDGIGTPGRLGHQVCDFLAKGWTGAQIEADTMATSHFSDGSSPTAGQVHGIVVAAERVYCPQYEGR
jgi:Protein of unknown function (DUF732)